MEEQEASVPLPGTFDISRCERVTAAVGKCPVCGPDHGSDCALEVSDRDRSLEDADPVVVPGVFSLSEDSVYWSAG